MIKDEDIGPNSVWEKGLPWMNEEIQDAIDSGILTPAMNLKVSNTEEDDYKKGFVFEHTPDILTKGHLVMHSARVEKVQSRGNFSNYIIFPTTYKIEKVIRILSLVRKFVRSFKCVEGKLKNTSMDMKFFMFQSSSAIKIDHDQNTFSIFSLLRISVIDEYQSWEQQYSQANIGFGVERPERIFKGDHYVELTNDDISWSLNYLYSKASQEVKKFYSADFIKKIAVEKNGILVSRRRILDCQRFKAAGGLEENSPISELGIKSITPIIDRYSPLALFMNI